MDDVFDIRDVIGRFEEIEDTEDAEEIAERAAFKEFLDDVQGNGGDEQKQQHDLGHEHQDAADPADHRLAQQVGDPPVLESRLVSNPAAVRLGALGTFRIRRTWIVTAGPATPDESTAWAPIV